MAQTPYKQLEQEWKRLHALRGAMAILRWDAAVMMPRGSADVRGEQLAALETEYHALVTAPKITRLLDRAQASTAGLEDWQIANLREMRRQRDFAIATPALLQEGDVLEIAFTSLRFTSKAPTGEMFVISRDYPTNIDRLEPPTRDTLHAMHPITLMSRSRVYWKRIAIVVLLLVMLAFLLAILR